MGAAARPVQRMGFIVLARCVLQGSRTNMSTWKACVPGGRALFLLESPLCVNWRVHMADVVRDGGGVGAELWDTSFCLMRAGRYLFHLEGSRSGLAHAVIGMCWPSLPLFVRSVGMARIGASSCGICDRRSSPSRNGVFTASCSFEDFDRICG
ncbi:unnamed protein product [Ostreobium quekettii]|uniref:Uncharacterized protein n=1 Tax=Ostreobium quekettii TaxID=121088 RepID=A0A8S1J671_9CHLO|nr:unnamed protein product [Ostreobium quekettii]